MTAASTALPEPFVDVDLPLPGRRVGKVRVSYDLPGGRRLFVTTDRLSAFDRIVAGVPYKGQVLNELAWWWFRTTTDIVANHALAVPDPNALIALAARPLPVEVIVRARITGSTSTSLWQRYAEGQRTIDGYDLPDGLRKHDELPRPIITPTTKAELGGHDEPFSVAEVVSRGLVAPDVWEQTCAAALALFARGAEVGRRAGLVLADTKYEFGLGPNGELLLIDEVHTPDSSRFWAVDTMDDRIRAGLAPESYDKEPVRLALKAAGYSGSGPVPHLPESVLADTSARYVELYERLTGLAFEPGERPIAERIAANLAPLAGQ